MEENAILQRIRELIVVKNMSENAFAKACGIGQKTLNSAFNRNADVKFSTLYQILSNFPDVSAEWLMRGKGDMFLRENPTNSVNITNVHRSNTGSIATGAAAAHSSSSEECAFLREQIKEKDARIKELTDTIVKIALK